MENDYLCFITKHHRFLWWTWKSQKYIHEFAYFDNNLRECVKCGRKEIYLGTTNYGLEDWRLTK